MPLEPPPPGAACRAPLAARLPSRVMGDGERPGLPSHHAQRGADSGPAPRRSARPACQVALRGYPSHAIARVDPSEPLAMKAQAGRARRAPPETRSALTPAGARIWAIASARRDREIVSSARLILVISKRVSDLSADPSDACSRAAGQLTRRDARLLQSPRSGTLTGGHALAAGIAQTEQCARDCWISIKAAADLAAVVSRSVVTTELDRSALASAACAAVR
jgi:hypothetical protein